MAVNAGKKVLLVDERPNFGGNLNFSNKDYYKMYKIEKRILNLV